MSNWPPPLANRATRRACAHRSKGGICADCGTVTNPTLAAEEAARVASVPSVSKEETE